MPRPLKPRTRHALARAVRIGLAGLALTPAPALASDPAAMWSLGDDRPAPPAPPPQEPPPVVPGVGPSWQLDTQIFGSAYSLHETAAAALDVSGNRGGGSLDVNHFLAPLIDDGAPYSLRPFLQRESAIYATVAGTGFLTRNPYGGPDRTSSYLGLSAGLDVYVERHVALTASLGYSYDVLHDVNTSQKTNGFSGSAGLGFRGGDVRFDVSYTFSARDVDGTFAKLRWGVAQASVFAVLGRRFTLHPWGRAIQGGGEGGLDLGFYATRELGLFLSGFGGRGDLYSDDLVVTRYGGEAGLSYWVAPSFRLSAYYTLRFTDLPVQVANQLAYGYHEIEHSLSLRGLLRLP